MSNVNEESVVAVAAATVWVSKSLRFLAPLGMTCRHDDCPYQRLEAWFQ